MRFSTRGLALTVGAVTVLGFAGVSATAFADEATPVPVQPTPSSYQPAVEPAIPAPSKSAAETVAPTPSAYQPTATEPALPSAPAAVPSASMAVPSASAAGKPAVIPGKGPTASPAPAKPTVTPGSGPAVTKAPKPSATPSRSS
jgi:hypothetical protein